MRITLLTPEQARAVGAALQRLRGWWRRVRELLTALARQIAENARRIARLTARLASDTRARVRTDRPAWASPYGPAPKGFR